MSALRFRSSFERELVRWAEHRGWSVAGRTGTNHIIVLWPATGYRQAVPSTGGGRLLRNVQMQLQRAEARPPPA